MRYYCGKCHLLIISAFHSRAQGRFNNFFNPMAAHLLRENKWSENVLRTTRASALLPDLQESLPWLHGQPAFGKAHIHTWGSAITPHRDKFIEVWTLNFFQLQTVNLCCTWLGGLSVLFCCSWCTPYGSSVIHSPVYQGKASQKWDKSIPWSWEHACPRGLLQLRGR